MAWWCAANIMTREVYIGCMAVVLSKTQTQGPASTSLLGLHMHVLARIDRPRRKRNYSFLFTIRWDVSINDLLIISLSRQGYRSHYYKYYWWIRSKKLQTGRKNSEILHGLTSCCLRHCKVLYRLTKTTNYHWLSSQEKNVTKSFSLSRTKRNER